MRFLLFFLIFATFSGCYALRGGSDKDNPCRLAASLVLEREALQQDFDTQSDYYRKREVQRKLIENQRRLDAADAACEESRRT